MSDSFERIWDRKLGANGQVGPCVTYYPRGKGAESRWWCHTAWGPRFTAEEAREWFARAEDRDTGEEVPFVSISRKVLDDTEARLVLIEHPEAGKMLVEIYES